MKTLDEVRKFLSTIPSINHGGCGIAAYAMYKWLQANDQLDSHFKFVMLYKSWEDGTMINNAQILRSKDGEPKAMSHICIYNEEQTIDCEDDIVLPNYAYVQFVDQEWFILNMLNNMSSWNPSFDRQWLPEIEEKLGIDLSEIDRH